MGLGEIVTHGQPKGVNPTLGAQRLDPAHQGLPRTPSASGGVDEHPSQFRHSWLYDPRAPAPHDPFSIAEDDEEARIAFEIVAGLVEHRLLTLAISGIPAPVTPDDVRVKASEDRASG